jgi:hypothetical protein
LLSSNTPTLTSATRATSERANRVKPASSAVGHDLLQLPDAARLTLSELADVQVTPDAIRLAAIASALTTIEDLLGRSSICRNSGAGAFVPKLSRWRLTTSLSALRSSSPSPARKA